MTYSTLAAIPRDSRVCFKLRLACNLASLRHAAKWRRRLVYSICLRHIRTALVLVITCITCNIRLPRDVRAGPAHLQLQFASFRLHPTTDALPSHSLLVELADPTCTPSLSCSFRLTSLSRVHFGPLLTGPTPVIVTPFASSRKFPPQRISQHLLFFFSCLRHLTSKSTLLLLGLLPWFFVL